MVHDTRFFKGFPLKGRLPLPLGLPTQDKNCTSMHLQATAISCMPSRESPDKNLDAICYPRKHPRGSHQLSPDLSSTGRCQLTANSRASAVSTQTAPFRCHSEYPHLVTGDSDDLPSERYFHFSQEVEIEIPPENLNLYQTNECEMARFLSSNSYQRSLGTSKNPKLTIKLSSGTEFLRSQSPFLTSPSVEAENKCKIDTIEGFEEVAGLSPDFMEYYSSKVAQKEKKMIAD